MGITDRLKDLTKKAEDAAVEHKDQIQEAVQKAATAADQRTQGRYSEQIQKAGAKADALVAKLDRDGTGPGEGGAPSPRAPAEGGAPGEPPKAETN